MVKYLLTTLILFCIWSCSSSKNNVPSTVLGGKKLIAEIKGDSIIVLANERAMIDALNSKFAYDSVYDSFSVVKEYTHGDEQKEFYYMHISSSSKNLNTVRWLILEDNKLWIDNSYNRKAYNHLDFYFTCDGYEMCTPKLFYANKRYIWGCREFLGCVTDEEALTRPCKGSTSVFK